MDQMIRNLILDIISLLDKEHLIRDMLLILLIDGLLWLRLKKIKSQKEEYLTGKRLGRYENSIDNYYSDLEITIFGIALSTILIGILLYLQLSM
ncbi:hypothetical protein M0P28_09655 [Streptococcus pasteurianus]|uniref:Uncharacterized protein n=1 Tax=Streptococcus macedonicus TaxID=59310 RepID=A0A2G3NS40_STRMC|nr:MULTISPECIES: hypothetical protein [Streptococcus]MDV5117458.1 hypothetical protein [Streptococcus pasteurianus]MDV5155319.1 hypothetical protein [Streptococcus pasteurianus]MDV5164180.1 hypothetical protein [Streptococcus pasteurianus]PHV56370.1 hypothetical protein CS010_07965 [Streptococcus macedonicus]WCQ72076.1 hypothetical protein M0P28_09655 [Streptococcus pasteurianus]